MAISRDTASTISPRTRPRAVARQSVPPPRVSRRRVLKSGLGLIGAGGLIGTGGTAYAAAEAAFDLQITEYAPVVPNWPRGQKLTIAVIADIHAGGPNMGVGRIAEVVDAANALNCDLTVLLGDYFATHRFVTEPVPPPVWAAQLARLRAHLGVYAILGNHDWWYDVAGVRAALAGVKIPLMENQALRLGDGARRFWLAGLGDQIAYRLGRGKFRGVDDLPGTLAQVRGQGAAQEPVILLVHEPDIFTEVPERVSLTLAGHTHGGQIRVPFVWPAFVPSAYGARFAYGHIVERGRHLIVSGGLGTSSVPMRLGVPPEIVKVTLGA